MSDANAIGAIEAPSADWARHDELAERTSGLRGVAGFSAERWFQIAGWVLPPLGLVLVLLGWYGAASTSRVWKQIPYVASGGMLGISFIFAGGLAYLASWLTRLVNETTAQSAQAAAAAQRTADALERIERLLRSTQGGGGNGQQLVATANGSMVHRPDCPMIEGRDSLRPVRAGDPGLRPCMVCQPLAVTT